MATKSIANVVPNRWVPWLGTRFAGLFSAIHRPWNGNRSATGGVRNMPAPPAAHSGVARSSDTLSVTRGTTPPGPTRLVQVEAGRP